MAITVEARKDILSIVVGMFNGAPGATILSQLTNAFEAGSTRLQIATNLAGTAEYLSIFPAFQTNSEFATKLVNNMLGSLVTDANKAVAVELLTARLNAANTSTPAAKAAARAEVSIYALDLLKAVPTTDAGFGAARVALDNKVEVATFYSVDKALNPASVTAAQTVIGTVSNTADSVTTAKATISGTADAGQTFTLTASLDNIVGTERNDLIVGNLTDAEGNQAGGDLELSDSIDGAGGDDTMLLYAWGNDADGVELDTTGWGDIEEIGVSGVETLIVQGRNGGGPNLTMDLAGMQDLQALEVRNFISGGSTDLNIDNVAGSMMIDNFSGEDINVNVVGGDLVLQDIQANNVYFEDVAGSVTVREAGVTSDGFFSGSMIFEGVGGDVSLESVALDGNLNINDLAGSNVSLADIDTNANIDVTFADTVTAATVTLDNVQMGTNDNSFVDIEGAALENLTINVVSDSNLAELHLDHDTPLSSITVNATGDLYLEALQGPEDADDNDLPATLTINGAGNVNIATITDDDNLNIVYTGSGALGIGTEELDDSNSSFNGNGWEPASGSLDASTATGDVTLVLELDDSNISSFSFIGSSGVNTVVVQDAFAAVVDDEATISIAAGSGTSDMLVIGDDSDVAEDVVGIYSGFETLMIADMNGNQTYDLTHATQFSSLVIDTVLGDSNENNLTVTGLSAAMAQDITINYRDGDDDNMFNDLTLSLADASGTADAMKITLYMDANEYDGNEYADDDVTINGVETLTIHSTGDANAIDDNLQNELTDQELVMDDLRTLILTGDLSFDLDGIYGDNNGNQPVENFELMDTTLFTGNYVQIDRIRTAGGFELAGGNSDHNININAIGDDVTISLGDGDNNINVYVTEESVSDDVIITAGNGDNDFYVDGNNNLLDTYITSGDGNNNIDVNNVRDVVINLGNGNNDVYINDAYGDVVVTTGSGDDRVELDYDGNIESAEINTGDGNDTIIIEDGINLSINAGAGDDSVWLDMSDINGNGSIEVTLGAGDDLLTLFDAEGLTAWGVAEVSDFSVADDTLALMLGDFEGVFSYEVAVVRDGEYDLTSEVAPGNTAILEFAFEADHNDVDYAAEYAEGNLDGSDLLESVGFDLNQGGILVDEGSEGYIIAYNGGDAYLFGYEAGFESDPSATITYHDDGFNDGNGNGIEDLENVEVLLSAGDEGFEVGDSITFFNLLDGDDDFVYTIREGETAVDTLGASIAAAVNALSNKAYDAAYDTVTNELYFNGANGYGDYTNVTVSYNNVNQSVYLDTNDIQLIGVFSDVAVGSFTQDNIVPVNIV